MYRAVLTIAALVAATAAQAGQLQGKPFGVEDVEWQLSPPPAEAMIASAGSVMMSRVRFGVVRITRYEGPRRISIKGGDFWNDDDLAVTNLPSGIAACNYYLGDKQCLVDANRDGIFEAGGRLLSSGTVLLPLKAPVPYRPPTTVEVKDPSGEFRADIVFLGEGAGVLRFGYREFHNDMARPAFSEELTIAKPAKLPAAIALKDLSVEILEISPAGIRFAAAKLAPS